MAKQVQQFRFYSISEKSKNQPSSINVSNIVAGSVFAPYTPITQLGIQALPGTKFYLNNSTNPIIIGYTGIYELDLEGIAEIHSLAFEKKSIEAINSINNASLIVDIIYEKDGDN